AGRRTVPEKVVLMKTMGEVLTREERCNKILRSFEKPTAELGAPKKLSEASKRRMIRELVKAPGSSCDDLGAKCAPIKGVHALGPSQMKTLHGVDTRVPLCCSAPEGQEG
ncbi:hypothetical protein FOZ63_020210, partial [Perkinsus olseni]